MSAKHLPKFSQNLTHKTHKTLKNVFLFTTDKQHACEEQKVVLAVLPGIAVNFTDQKLCRLKSRKK